MSCGNWRLLAVSHKENRTYGTGQNAESYSLQYPMEYPLESVFGQSKCFINMMRHLDVHSVIYVELSNNIKHFFQFSHGSFRTIFSLRNVFSWVIAACRLTVVLEMHLQIILLPVGTTMACVSEILLTRCWGETELDRGRGRPSRFWVYILIEKRNESVWV